MGHVHHIDLVVSSLQRSLAFHGGLLQWLGNVIGVHHVAFTAPSRRAVDECANSKDPDFVREVAALRERVAQLEGRAS